MQNPARWAVAACSQLLPIPAGAGEQTHVAMLLPIGAPDPIGANPKKNPTKSSRKS